MGLFRKKIFVGDSVETVLAFIEHLEKSNIPYKYSFKDIFTFPSESSTLNENENVSKWYITI